jgi:four helix bundle protein
MESNKAASDLEERLLEYSARIIRLSERMTNSQAARHVSNQLLRSGTAPMAHHGEAQAAESPKDFIYKLRIALKELRETSRWLKLSQRVPLLTKPGLLSELLDETDQLIRICHSSISTAKQKLK